MVCFACNIKHKAFCVPLILLLSTAGITILVAIVALHLWDYPSAILAIGVVFAVLSGTTISPIALAWPLIQPTLEPSQCPTCSSHFPIGTQLCLNQQCLCVNCRMKHRNANHDFCGEDCGTAFFEHVPTQGNKSANLSDPRRDIGLVKIDETITPKTFQSVKHQFESTWTHPTTQKPKGFVKTISRIIQRKDFVDKHAEYKRGVQADMERENPDTHIRDANTRRRFHGTTVKCTAGTGSTAVCRDATCALCNIIRTGFDPTRTTSNTGGARFGRGIYFSATSSKANDYVNMLGGGHRKVMLMCAVVCGKIDFQVKSSWTLKSIIPKGFHCVVGDTKRSPDLKYDETVVDNTYAARCTYLIEYSQ
ncbi:UNVERIFIED_CONTAM: hypothetical protein HDU68_002599 [Siphonaria sp. JEL0065]|nr:hypothetical protein HDU68_002599 [Siphonaria sp. JEL0065]